MTDPPTNQVFLSYSSGNREFVEALARRLRGDARLAFWFAPWHSIPGAPMQEQMEEALRQAQSCAVFLSGGGQIEGWQNEQMRVAIQTRVEDEAGYRIIPVLLPGKARPTRRDLPGFLRRYEMVEFADLTDQSAYQRLLAGILGVSPVQVDGYVFNESLKARLDPSSGAFEQGHALLIAIANYPKVRSLPETTLNDARDLRDLLVDRARCGYLPGNVTQLLDREANAEGIRCALTNLATRCSESDTAVVFFSGHGARFVQDGLAQQVVLPYDCDLANPSETTLGNAEMTALLQAVPASRLLVLLDCCHSGGVGDPKTAMTQFKAGLNEDYYALLAQGRGRVVIASSRANEVSWMLTGMRNSLFTHYLLEALRGEAPMLGDGYVRVFDLFRHVADHVPKRANQHPVFKAAAMETDMPIAQVRR